MGVSYKTSLRSICATIQDLHTFFTDTRVVDAGVNLREPVEALRGKVVDTACSFMDERIGNLHVMNDKRFAWTEQRATALEKELASFSELMNRATAARPKINDVTVGYGPSKLTVGILKSGVDSILTVAKTSATRNPYPGATPEYPFDSIVNIAEIKGLAGRTGAPAAAALNA